MIMESNCQKCRTSITQIPKPLAGNREFLLLILNFATFRFTKVLFWQIYRAECEGNPVRYFAILSMQRSGSGWFESLLNSHINVSSNGEIFSVRLRRENISTIVQTLDKVYNLDWLSSAAKNQCSAAVGFKWMLNQVNNVFGFRLILIFHDCFLLGGCKLVW